MGHEVGVTTLQLARACSAVANGGLLVKPRLILKEGDKEMPVPPPQRILKPETAITMRQMMEGVVLFGTGRRYANLQGYSSAGKTGSAQIYDYATGHYTHSYNASFMGFAPVANPAIVVVASVNGTHGGSAGYGGPVAGPVFRAVITEALRVLDAPKDLPDSAPHPSGAQVADLDEVPTVEGAPELPPLDDADVPVPSVRPAAAATAPQTPKGPQAPNFLGLSKRAALALAQSQGLPVLTVGIGVVRAQYPPPGALLHAGERIRVELLR